MKRVAFLSLFLPLTVQSSFEAIDCGQESIFENPAEIKPGIQTLWVQAFGILPYTRISYSTPYNIGFGISNFGTNDYRENEILLGYSGRGLGVSVRAMGLWINGYGSDFAIGLDLGTRFQVTPSTNFILALSNINFPRISGEELPKRVMGGFVIKPSPDYRINVLLYKEAWYPMEVRVSNEIELSNLLTLMVGIKTYPASFSFGGCFSPGGFDILYNARTHPTLGFTHIMGVNYFEGGGVR